MMKIKEDKMKDLEKFGFKFKEDIGKWVLHYNLFDYIFICSWNRKIQMESLEGKASSVLIDLYKAGMVEVVEDGRI